MSNHPLFRVQILPFPSPSESSGLRGLTLKGEYAPNAIALKGVTHRETSGKKGDFQRRASQESDQASSS